MEELLIRSFRPEDEEAVIALWDDCGLVVPRNDPRRDIERKLKVNPELFLVGLADGEIIATCMAGYEGHRGWINYLAVAPAWRRKGIAARMMEKAEEALRRIGCPKINLQVRETNEEVIKFYESIGFGTDDVLSMSKRLEHDEPQ